MMAKKYGKRDRVRLVRQLRDRLQLIGCCANSKSVRDWTVVSGQVVRCVLKGFRLAIFIAFLTILLCLVFPSLKKSCFFAMITLFSSFRSDDRCLVAINRLPIDNLFLPSFDCSLCSSLKSVDIVGNMSQEEFTERYAYSSIPVVIRGGIKDWKASKEFSFAFFKHLYSSMPLQRVTRCQFFPYRTRFRTLLEALNMSENDATGKTASSSTWYIGWSNCDPHITKILRQYYRRPQFLPSYSEDSRLDWIFMGSPGYGANMHIDHVGHPSWQAQIKGTKRWTIEAPPECLFKCKTLQVEVHSGDIIVLDTDKWFHETFIVGDEMSITIGSEYD